MKFTPESRAVGNRPWWTLAAVSLGGMMAGLDGTALTIAGPEIARTTGTSLAGLQWVTTAYLLALAAALFPAGRLADRFGRRAVFLTGVLGFGVVSLLIALTSSIGMLVGLRALQGICGALLQPAALALLRAVFPPARLELALGIWGGASAAAIAAGPIVAGLLVEWAGWQAVFVVNVPIAVLTAAIAVARTGESRAVGEPGTIRELLRSPGVGAGAVLTALSYFSLFGLLFFLTLYLQNVRGLDPVGAGMWLLPVTVVVVVSAPAGGLLTGRFGPRLPAAAGLALVSVGLLGFTRLDAGTGWLDALPASVVLGLGTGVALIAATQLIVAGAPVSMSGLASALQQVATQIGGVLGIVALGAVMSLRAKAFVADDAVTRGAVPPGVAPDVAHHAFLTGFAATAIAAAAVTAVGAVVAVRLPPATGGSDRALAKRTGPPQSTSDVDGERGHQQ
ncbi:MFS transporter [Amycolatopsis sp. CA-230715]|uniref:MFS transporter n=1 Tax=Amycolatopsis sp. CA-230715 TaxID=2745196 RepID=UPI001C00D949|nr:MFS transporter [Amycolatopsis sp. CA-230715]QWF85194.1 Antiseptic resistance protein [Amycolatopsis sp. CA-230715]